MFYFSSKICGISCLGYETEASHFPMDLAADQDLGTEEMIGNPSPSVEYPQLDLTTVVPTETTESCENISSDSETTSSDDVELPSNVTDRKEIFMPMDLKRDDKRIYGKWLWFSNGDLYLQDQIWIQLANLILQGLVILQESSTARSCRVRERQQGVIKCYTRRGVEAIKKAGLAIQRIVNDGVILHYKSNKASDDNLNRMYGDRFISEYMLTACGVLYAKDELRRWKKVEEFVDSTSPNCPVADRLHPYGWSSLSDLDPMPSCESFKKRYFYPESSSVAEFDGSWSFFCSLGDFDRHGYSELDRLWIQAKRLVDEGVVYQALCETKAYDSSSQNLLSRCVSCVVKDYGGISRLVEPVDRLRNEVDYNFPVYFKVCRIFKREKKFLQKYLYSDDRELYEYVNDNWQLVAKGDDLNGHS